MKELISLAAEVKLTATVKLPKEFFVKAGYLTEPPPQSKPEECITIRLPNTGEAKLLEVSGDKVRVEIAGEEYLISLDDVQTIDLKTTKA